ncbi:MAG: release factor glutamine methyltransferase [Candidatus Atribacteria bacterium]|nr:release factor glutamine methyltransferase [Candidatus Atribacteria bacterium]
MERVRDVWKELVKTLRERGVSSPAQEARFILSRVVDTSPSRLYLFWDLSLSLQQREKLSQMLEKRLSGFPLQYVLGEWEFMSLPFQIEPGVFIPRLDTEAWIEKAILFLKERAKGEPLLICDLGCGSGMIGIACAFWVPSLQLQGVDISWKAVELSRKNARSLAVENRTTFLISDLFSAFEGKKVQFDTILSNPPYIPKDQWEQLSPEVKLYEPQLALLGGEDGLNIIRRIIQESPPFLKRGGRLYLEHDPDQLEALKTMVRNSPQLDYLESITDFTGKIRTSVVVKV